MEKERMTHVPERPDYAEELAKIIRSKASDEEIRDRLADYHENDIADALEDLNAEERRHLYRILGNEAVSELFPYLEDPAKYIAELKPEKAADIMESMDADDAAEILDELDETQGKQLLALMDAEARQDIKLIHSYSDEQIGSRMTTNYVAVVRGSTIRQAMKELVRQAADNDNISTIYVLDHEIFYGAVELQDLIRAREHDGLEDLIATSYPYVYANESIDECIEYLKDYSEDSIPVLDNDKHLLGVITAQEIIEVVDEEMGEDYAKLAGLTAEEDLEEPLLESMKKRMPWLVLLLFLGFVVSSVVGLFETVVQQIALVVCFQSVILDMAGNVGTQSLAVTIRVLMDENLTGKQKLLLVLKEMKIGGVNGLVLGSMAFVFVGLYIWLFKAKTVLFAFAVSTCIAVSLVGAMVVSSLVGTVVPIFFKKIHVDPAVASGPLITTVNDLVAVVIYYGLAWVLLLNVLGIVG